MKLQLIGTTFIKNKNQEPIFKLAKLLVIADGHIETVEFSYPPVNEAFMSDAEIVADLPNKVAQMAAHWQTLTEQGYSWHAYEQKWFK